MFEQGGADACFAPQLAYTGTDAASATSLSLAALVLAGAGIVLVRRARNGVVGS